MIVTVLCVKYKLQKSGKSSDDMSSEIIVVHQKGLPKLHGILKQRTVSESSDDGVRASSSGCDRQVSTTTGSEGDDPEDSPDRSAVSGGCRVLKKSVSFNDHVDHTLFQASQSVSSMHAALKNRRRRARKRDQKQEQREQRRRRRNSGSFSLEESGDEQTTAVRAAHVHTGKDGKNSRTFAESDADTKDCSSSSNVISDKADCYVFDGAEITEAKAYSSQNMVASGKGDVLESEKSSQSTGTLREGKLASDDTESKNYNYSDTLRTKNNLVHCGSDVVNNGVLEPDVCDNTSSVHVLSNGEICKSEVISMLCANDVSLSDSNASQSAASCDDDSVLELVKSSQSNDGIKSVAGPTSQSPDETELLTTCFPLDLDVD